MLHGRRPRVPAAAAAIAATASRTPTATITRGGAFSSFPAPSLATGARASHRQVPQGCCCCWQLLPGRKLHALLAAAARAQVACAAGKHACCLGRRPPCTLPPPARPAGDCPSSPLCRSTTAESGTLEILQDPCASSEKWSASDASLVVRPCSAVTLYQPGFIPGSCDSEPDGYTYLHIQ